MSITNIVATATLCQKINLRDIEIACGSVLCRRNRAFGSINIQCEKHSVLQIFNNQRLIIIGGKTEGQTKRLFLRYLRILSDLGMNVDYKNYQIQNIVACYDYGQTIKISKIAQQYNLEFEPELFPSVRYRDEDLKVTVNIFHTGKCVILGADTTEKVNIVIRDIKKLLQNVED